MCHTARAGRGHTITERLSLLFITAVDRNQTSYLYLFKSSFVYFLYEMLLDIVNKISKKPHIGPRPMGAAMLAMTACKIQNALERTQHNGTHSFCQLSFSLKLSNATLNRLFIIKRLFK